MRRGFTLIELLAVIVILAIIALIAVPIVINIINDAKKSSDEQSVELYKDTVEKAIVKENMKVKYEPDVCTIMDTGNIMCKKGNEDIYVEGTDKTLKIEIKGETPSEGTLYFTNGKISRYVNVKQKGKYYHQNLKGEKFITLNKKNGILVSDADGNMELSIGDKYTYNVNDKDAYNFYVLSIEGDKINLIMDRNLKQGVGWHLKENDNNYGPDNAMTNLYNATKDWDNVSDMIIDYEDENNQNSIEYGYTNIITRNGITTITGKSTTNTTTVETSEKPLKARLPILSEIMLTGCTTDRASCPVWLMEGLNLTPAFSFCSLCQKKYSQISNLTNSYGYWLLSSYLDSKKAVVIYSTGCLYYGDTKQLIYGIRPVITVPRSYLES